MKKILIIILSCFCVAAHAQDSTLVSAEDTIVASYDSTYFDEDEGEYYYDDEDEVEEKDYEARIDSATIPHREFNKTDVDKLKNDPNLKYKEISTVGESLWMRFLRWLSDLLNSLFEGAYDSEWNWGKIFWYLFAIVVISAITFVLIKVDAFKVIYSGGGSVVQHQVIEENIHEMDFEKLIQEAVQKNDYRRGIRLIFLYSLKMLSDKHFIEWEQGKTNHDYVAELKAPELKSGFNELSFYFEYAWYGNFTVTQDVFNKVQTIFSTWRANV